MKRSTLLVFLFTLAFASVTAYAQQTGGLTADNLYQFLSKQGTVNAKKVGSDVVSVLAKGNNSEVCSVRFAEPQVVTITRAIAKLDLRSKAAVRVLSAIATFN